MKRDLKLNMEALLWIAGRIRRQAEALRELEEASGEFLSALEGQDSRAYERLSAEWETDVGRREKGLRERLEAVAGMVEEYVRDMESLVMPVDEGKDMRVDRDDIWFNCLQIERNALDLGGILSDTGSSAVDYAGHFVYSLYDSPEENAARKAWMEEEERKEKARRERNYEKLAGFRLQVREAEGYIREEVEGIKRICRENVEPFEDRDDEYGRRMGEKYEDWCSYLNIVEDRFRVLSDVSEGMWDGGKDFVRGIYKTADGLGSIMLYDRLERLGLERLGLMPEGLTEKIGGMREGAREVIREPGNVLEGMGQEIFDRADEKGPAYMAGYVAADIAAGIVIDRGIGKLRGMGKADDVAEAVARAADDVPAGVMGNADDIGDAAGDIGRHLDDVAGGIGEGGRDVWDMAEGGGIINSREYSQHAMERMAPDSPSVRAELSRRAEALAESKGLQVGTPEYYQFCQKYVDPRNIPPSVIEDAIRNTTAVPGHTAGTYVHQTTDVTVIINDTGRVITVIPK